MAAAGCEIADNEDFAVISNMVLNIYDTSGLERLQDSSETPNYQRRPKKDPLCSISCWNVIIEYQ